MRLIDANRTQPFIGVFPTLMISPPRDTECTNVPGGPRAETWLARDVPRFTEQHFRVARPGQAWTTMGWSTGGFCAAKLVASHPALFGSAVSLGGYYQPLQDGTTGSLFGGRKRLALYNSPEWLYLHHGGLRGSRLLVVTGRQDRDTWRSTHQMIQTTAGDPAVAHIIFPRGGHNYRNYAAYLAPTLAWGASRWPTSSGQ
jgi:S-formylglutathione hydrolase FrmB